MQLHDAVGVNYETAPLLKSIKTHAAAYSIGLGGESWMIVCA